MSQRNIPLFIAFRVLYNARFYYPIYGILFLDFGVTLAELAVLNGVWAAAIVLLEVPSGALADVLGRRRLVIAAAVLMLLEMLLFACAPVGGGAALFAVLLANRVLSGASEAAASGADEALAYDSLVQDGREAEWPAVLARLMRWQSGCFVLAMILGAAVYDPGVLNAATAWIGGDATWQAADTLRLPVLLTLASAVLLVPVALAMREPRVHRPLPGGDGQPAEEPGTWRQIVETGRWILAHRAVLLLMLAAMCGDSVVRTFLTINSNYYRAIGLPAWSYGLLGAGMAVLGFVAAGLARRAVERHGAVANFLGLGVLLFAGLAGAVPAIAGWGALVMVPLGLGFFALQFFVAHYLNAVTASHRRATVLSFKNLALNLGYGLATLLYAALAWAIRQAEPGAGEDAVLIATLPWLAGWFVVTAIVLALYASRKVPWK